MSQNSLSRQDGINQEAQSRFENPQPAIENQAQSLLQKRERILQMGESNSDNQFKSETDFSSNKPDHHISLPTDLNEGKGLNGKEEVKLSSDSKTHQNEQIKKGEEEQKNNEEGYLQQKESETTTYSSIPHHKTSIGGIDKQDSLNQKPPQISQFSSQEKALQEQEDIFCKNSQENQEQINSEQRESQNSLDMQNISSSNQEQMIINGRGGMRKCRAKTTNYSKTHKGSYTMMVSSNQNNNSEQLNSLKGGQGRNQGRNIDNKQNSKGIEGTSKECIECFKNMFAFDWDLKDISSLRQSPQQELTPAVFWFYVNSLYFPYNAVILSETPFEKFLRPVLQNLIPNHINEEQKYYNDNIKSYNDKNSTELTDTEVSVPLLKSLFQEKNLNKFRKIFKELQGSALMESFNPQQPTEEIQEKVEGETEVMEQETLEAQQQMKFKNMITVLEREIANLRDQNREALKNHYTEFQKRYQNSLDPENNEVDQRVYRGDEVEQYGIDFQGYIDPRYTKDIKANFEWYHENNNEILLNVVYPSRQEKEFLKHIEQVQQKNNDIKYKKILKQIEQGKKGQAILSDLKYENLSMQKRALVTQEDAQCAICNNGDYEDEDLIVFCGNCNIPVHQTCYGIDFLPEGDWICYNCSIFGFKRGLLVPCLLCPKKGGAMKATNIFTNLEDFKRFNHGSSGKKSGKKVQHQESGKSLYSEREDKQLSLNNVLKREYDYQCKLRIEDNHIEEEISHIELHFDSSEKEAQLPEDYTFFIQRNQNKLESEFTPQVPTLYQWVHLSCASWIPGLLVTPKTPVRLNKLDDKRFQLQCIICLRKGGACMQCQYSRCQISFHVECARRANYCMEIEREKEKTYRMFCEKHRPLKIVKEMEERDKQTVEEIQKFCKIIDKCMEIEQRVQARQKTEKDTHHNHSSRGNHANQRGGEREVKAKKWREKDKKVLFERVKEKYLMYRKMKVLLIRIDPSKKLKKSQQRRRSKKRQQKVQHQGGCRSGLRSKQESMNQFGLNELEFQNEQSQKLDQSEMIPQSEGLEEDKVEDQTLGVENDQENPESANQIHYKFATPMHPNETDWSITLSRNDFPWNEIKFNNFNSKDCFEKYISIIKDPQTFLKKVLGNKEKYKKMMENQINAMNSHQQVIVPLVGGGNYDQSAYCICHGKFNSDFFVRCDGDDECKNGAWLHPECTSDLKDQTKEILEHMDEWYCEDCVLRIQRENEEENEGTGVLRQYEDATMRSEDEENFKSKGFQENSNEMIMDPQEREEQEGLGMIGMEE